MDGAKFLIEILIQLFKSLVAEKISWWISKDDDIRIIMSNGQKEEKSDNNTKTYIFYEFYKIFAIHIDHFVIQLKIIQITHQRLMDND
jgi:hypothetical protein